MSEEKVVDMAEKPSHPADGETEEREKRLEVIFLCRTDVSRVDDDEEEDGKGPSAGD